MCQRGKLVPRRRRCGPDLEMLTVERSAKVRMQLNQTQEMVKGESDQFPPKGRLQESSWGVVRELGFEGQAKPARGEPIKNRHKTRNQIPYSDFLTFPFLSVFKFLKSISGLQWRKSTKKVEPLECC